MGIRKDVHIANYQRNENQNNNEVSPHTFRMAAIKKSTITNVDKMWIKHNPCILFAGMYPGAAAMEESMKVPQKNRTAV